jgi:DMSO/TMAO reductase YedYZ molybdopterin-dependent catalytic subunit
MRKTTLRYLTSACHIISELAIQVNFRSIRVYYFLIILLAMFGFGVYPVAGAENNMADSGGKQINSKPCNPLPITIPKAPKIIPGYAELDKATGLHVTGTIPEIDFDSYRLEVTGKVKNILKLSYDDLRCMPKIETRPVLECPGFFKDKATWAGVSIKDVLELAGVQEEAREINLISADEYENSVSLKQVYAGPGFLAYEWEGKPLPLLHGFPVRAVFPGLLGNYWVKWLVRIEVK